jgi:hypothetical protein
MRQPAARPRLVSSDRDRITALERRADAHDAMAGQVGEMHEAYTRFMNINWFLVKVAAYIGGFFGFCAVVLTVVTGVQRLLVGH